MHSAVASAPTPLVSRTERVAAVDPLALAAVCDDLPLFYWEHPARRHALLALGAVRTIRAGGARRFADASDAARALLASVQICGASSSGPLVVGGFAFGDDDPGGEWHDFGAARLVLPALLWELRGDRCLLTRTTYAGAEGALEALLAEVLAATRHGPAAGAAATLGAGVAAPAHGSAPMSDATARGMPAGDGCPRAGRDAEDDDRRAWGERVRVAGELIASGALRKVVLARRRELRIAPLSPAALLAAARARRPACFTFWIRPTRRASLVGSTPELLARRTGAWVESDALAGSVPRAGGAAADRALGASLRRSAKTRREHALVVRSIRDALAPLATRLTCTGPRVMRLPEAQHLATRIRGQLTAPRTVIELGGVLHPTPAVCGVPRVRARALIAAAEPWRGWYSGAVGWMDRDGDGELAVTLRAALMQGERIVLWAGAGIVEGSEAAAESAEVEAKMAALLP